MPKTPRRKDYPGTPSVTESSSQDRQRAHGVGPGAGQEAPGGHAATTPPRGSGRPAPSTSRTPDVRREAQRPLLPRGRPPAGAGGLPRRLGPQTKDAGAGCCLSLPAARRHRDTVKSKAGLGVS